ncbi:pyruvate kinase [Halomicroarcula sp. F13]|uniref:Pyruvate kinase n=1 Tax=Haloarcula rubra TaxID=2487747 RepID=A0AAW4PXE7_9EURY|nr:pyruvate kinase [Halomicroarcula rubra]
MRTTKIVCTIGPASASRNSLRRLAEAGMSVARLNASHGTPEHRRELIERIRTVEQNTDRPVAIIHDLPGPKVRTAPMDGTVHLDAGTTVEYVQGKTTTNDRIALSHDITAVESGDRVLLDDGRIETTVTDVSESAVTACVENSDDIGGRKGVVVPGVELGLPTITERDRRELRVAAEKEVDFVAASFVRDGDSVRAISRVLSDLDATTPIIAKVERGIAVRNLDDIIDAADGVMVARGDLGVEIPLESVPIVQKRIIRRCRDTGTPVITATEMLESMTSARRPTRAEASDVANAVFDGTDAVMLSGETAVGDHPVLVVETMARLVERVEDTAEYDDLRRQQAPEADSAQSDKLARSASVLGRDIDATAIVVATASGKTAVRAAKFRPSMPVVAATPSESVRRRLALSGGIVSGPPTETATSADDVIGNAVESALGTDIVSSGDRVVVISGPRNDDAGTGTSNLLKIHVASDRSSNARE